MPKGLRGFQKGHKINLGRKCSENHKKKISNSEKGKIVSIQTKNKISLIKKGCIMLKTRGKNHWNWKGEIPNYRTLHKWLRKNYGKPKRCSFCNKEGKIINKKWNIEYALRKGKIYNRNIKNYIFLCHKCHKNYDKNQLISS